MSSPLEDFLTEYRIQFRQGGTHQHVCHGWIGLQCPKCHTLKWHLGVRLSDGFTTCWRCGGQNLYQVLLELSGARSTDVLNLVRSLKTHVESPPKFTGRGGSVLLPKGLGPLQKPHVHYLVQRGFDPDSLVSTWAIKGIGLAGHLSWRVWIPVIVHGQLVSWTTRTVGTAGPRYISARPDQETVALKATLYGSDLASNVIVVVEGPTDAWALGPGAVATYGLEVSRIQRFEIGAYPVRVICFDNSTTAQRRAERLADSLAVFPGDTHVALLESGDDPGSAEREEIEELRKKFGL